MYQLLLSEKMAPFYENIASFPTAFFTFFLLLTIFYWLVAVLGWVEIDVLDFDVPEDLSINADNATSSLEALAGLLHRLGLNGVPITLVISFISFIGWLVCYYAVHFLMFWVPSGLLRYVAGLPILIISLYVAALLTAQMIKPIRPFFKVRAPSVKHIIGQIAVVKTSWADASFGEATMEDGGAGLLLKIRATGKDKFEKNDRVALIEYLEEEGAYRVVSEQEFSGT